MIDFPDYPREPGVLPDIDPASALRLAEELTKLAHRALAGEFRVPEADRVPLGSWRDSDGVVHDHGC